MSLAVRPLAGRIAGLAEAQTLGMAQRVRELKARGRDVISLLLGEPDFAVPTLLQEAATSAITMGHAPYPPVAGLAELRAAIADYYAARFGVSYSPDQVVVSNGSKQAIYNSLLALLDPGDEVLIPVPYWVSYPPLVHLAEGRVVLLPTSANTGYKLLPDQLEAAITPKTRVIILNSPSNPTGRVYTRAELEALVAVLERHPNVWVISDEIYELLVYEGRAVSLAEFASMRERVIICNGFSKAFAMPGWRLGYAIAPLAVAQALVKVQGQTTAGANVIAQKAAIAGLRADIPALVQPMLQAFAQRRDAIYHYLSQHLPAVRPYLPEGAFYYFLDVSAYVGFRTSQGILLTEADALTEYLLDQGVAVVSGTGFGSANHIRVSYAVAVEDIQEGLRRIQHALAALA